VTTYAILNESTAPELSTAALLELANDGQLAYDKDYAPACGTLPIDVVVVESVHEAARCFGKVRLIHIVDILDDPQALAYHTYDDRGIPVLRVGANACRSEAEAEGKPCLYVISDALMHEIFETERNPFVNKYVAGPWRDKKVADEACDPLQGSGYRCGKTWIPNFTLPAWSDPSDADGPYDFVSTLPRTPRVLSAPFTKLSTGYLAFDDGSQDFGEHMSERARARAGRRLIARKHATAVG
jgi:hypothetical protein